MHAKCTKELTYYFGLFLIHLGMTTHRLFSATSVQKESYEDTLALSAYHADLEDDSSSDDEQFSEFSLLSIPMPRLNIPRLKNVNNASHFSPSSSDNDIVDDSHINYGRKRSKKAMLKSHANATIDLSLTPPVLHLKNKESVGQCQANVFKMAEIRYFPMCLYCCWLYGYALVYNNIKVIIITIYGAQSLQKSHITHHCLPYSIPLGPPYAWHSFPSTTIP